MSNSFLNYFWNKTFFLIFIIVILLNVLLLWSFTFYYPAVGKDGSFDLVVGRDIFMQFSGFYNIDVPYNPLGIYIYGLPNLISKNTEYLTISLLLIISIFNIFQFNLLLKKVNIDRYIRIFIVTIFIFYSSFLGGTYIYLEQITFSFILVTIYFYLNRQYFLTGCFLFLAFYTKQYALAIVLPIIIQTLLEAKFKIAIKNLITLLSGFIGILIIMYFIHAN